MAGVLGKRENEVNKKEKLIQKLKEFNIDGAVKQLDYFIHWVTCDIKSTSDEEIVKIVEFAMELQCPETMIDFYCLAFHVKQTRIWFHWNGNSKHRPKGESISLDDFKSFINSTQ